MKTELAPCLNQTCRIWATGGNLWNYLSLRTVNSVCIEACPAKDKKSKEFNSRSQCWHWWGGSHPIGQFVKGLNIPWFAGRCRGGRAGGAGLRHHPVHRAAPQGAPGGGAWWQGLPPPRLHLPQVLHTGQQLQCCVFVLVMICVCFSGHNWGKGGCWKRLCCG